MKSMSLATILTMIVAFNLMMQTVPQQAPNYRPIIGIVTTPSEYPDVYNPQNYSYLASSYVKFVESGGARVVPIQYDLPEANLSTLFSYLNGFLFTGGAQNLLQPNGSLTQYANTINTLLWWSINASLAGNYTPVWGTCEGFQYISYLISGNYSIVVNMSGLDDAALNLTWNTTTYATSRTFAGFPEDLYEAVQTDDITYYHCSYTTDPAAWNSNPGLMEYLVPIANSTNPNGTSFVAYVEGSVINGSVIPVYSSQFHPEKITFEWDEELSIPHSYDAIRVEQWLANFFVNETRNNYNQFPNETYAAQFVIENFNTTVLLEASFQTIYFFENVNWTGPTGTNANVNPSLLSYLAQNGEEL